MRIVNTKRIIDATKPEDERVCLADLGDEACPDGQTALTARPVRLLGALGSRSVDAAGGRACY
jgi:hypothetical protein